MIGGRDVVINIPTNASTPAWLDSRIRDHWRECVVEVESDRERFYFRDAAAKAAWDKDGGTDENAETMIHAIFETDALTLVVSHLEGSETAAFALGLKEDEEEEAENEKRQRLRAERRALLAPGCCEAMRRTKAIYAGDDAFDEPAKWQLRLADNSRSVDEALLTDERQWFYDQYQKQKEHPGTEFADFVPPPTHCPFCGAKLGELVKKTDPPAPLQHTTDMNYCDTCGERNMNCACWAPWAARQERRS